jgi:hypothetical protein
VPLLLQTYAKKRDDDPTAGASLRFGSESGEVPMRSAAADAKQSTLIINNPRHESEREADRIADHVMGMSMPQSRRACACDEACPDCRTAQPIEQHERLQTRRVQGSNVGHILAPPIVDAVIAEPGQMLAPAVHAFMQPRFGHDFNRVRVHSDAKAAESARAVNAVAYTAGQHVVFQGSAFAPETVEGKRLLAHELAHVIQQEKGRTEMHGVAGSDTAQLLQRATDGETNALPTPEELDSKPKKVCGPDITKQLKAAQRKTRKQFAGWTNSRKEDACQHLVSIIFGPIGWDIIQLYDNDWILQKYGKVCASEGASPSCIKSVRVDENCFYAGSVNYAHFGNMFDLCQGYYASAFPLNKQFTETEMFKWIRLYKGSSANYQSSADWAQAGFYNWPHGALTPAGDRPNCSPTCPLPYMWGDFDVNWDGETF